METRDFMFDLPKHRSSAIKVIGVGGGGSNAVNYMYEQGIEGVDFVICNTDSQALNNSPVPNRLQLENKLHWKVLMILKVFWMNIPKWFL